MKSMLIFGALCGALVGISVGLTVFFLGGTPTAPADGGDAMVVTDLDKQKNAIYEQFHPAITVNILEDGKPRFLQLELVVVGYDIADIDALRLHMPAVRNAVLIATSEQDAMALRQPGGQQKLQTVLLGVVQEKMKELYGKVAVEDAYFTKFIIQ